MTPTGIKLAKTVLLVVAASALVPRFGLVQADVETKALVGAWRACLSVDDAQPAMSVCGQVSLTDIDACGAFHGTYAMDFRAFEPLVNPPRDSANVGWSVIQGGAEWKSCVA